VINYTCKIVLRAGYVIKKQLYQTLSAQYINIVDCLKQWFRRDAE